MTKNQIKLGYEVKTGDGDIKMMQQIAVTEPQSPKQIWYDRTFVLMEICKIAKNRELSFLPAADSANRIRCINASFVDILKKNFVGFHFMERNFNFYYSLAHLKNMYVRVERLNEKSIKIYAYEPREPTEKQLKEAKKFYSIIKSTIRQHER